ncbi:hypothetical protein HDV64DRAFT_89445 [Trichoderma sp. TUCIM 5745]
MTKDTREKKKGIGHSFVIWTKAHALMIQRIACIGTDMHCNINRREIRNTVHGTYYSLTRTDGINSTNRSVTDTKTACYLFCFLMIFFSFLSFSFLHFLSLLYQSSVKASSALLFLFLFGYYYPVYG